MNCKMISLYFVLAFLTVSVAAQDVSKLEYPKLNQLNLPEVKRVTLDNGMRLYLVEDHALPTFSMSVRINCGSYLEPEEKIGLASICGTVLRTGGTGKWSGDELDEILEGVGASVETSIGLSSGSASVRALSEHRDMVLDILAEILRNPVFDEDKIELARIQERAGISRRNDEPLGLGFREFNKLIYGPKSVYARYPEYVTINAITRDDLLSFYQQWFQPQNIQIAIWGDFKTKEIVKQIKARFGDWKRDGMEVPPLPRVDYKFEQAVYYAAKTEVNQSGIFLGHIGGRTTDPDYPVLVVMNNIMGGGLGNRMFNVIRSREGLAYGILGQYTTNISYPGIFVNYVGTKSETTAKAIRLAVEVIQSMQDDPPTDEELTKGKEGYLNSFVFNFDTKAEIVNRLMTYDFYGVPDDFLNQVKSRIERVTADDVVTAAKKHLHPEALKLLVVGNSADFDIPLDQLGMGTVAALDISIPPAEEKRELDITPENLEKGHSILASAVEAHGGLKNFKQVRSVSAKGKFVLVMQGREIPLAFTELWELPDKRSQIIDAFGRKMYDIRNGNSGWKTDQATGQIAEKSEEDLIADHKEMARNTVWVFQTSDNPEYRAVFDGTGKVADVEVNFVALVDEADDLICRYGFNRETNELVCKYYYDKTMLGEGTVETLLGDFKEVSGVRLPMAIIQNFGGQKIGEVIFSTFDINADISPSAFDKPE